jgi:hypothetical protein
MTTWLIDISNHQGPFDVGRAVSEGYSGVWMKATEGTTFRDDRFDVFAGQVLASGAVPGAYHYLRSGSGRAQCDAFYGRIRDHGGPDGWLAACDNEADASWQTTVGFFARWRELAGDHPLFMYSGNWWWSKLGWNGASLTPYLWDSRYVSGSGYGSVLYGKVPEAWWKPRYGGWDTTTVLQFSASGRVAGREVDVSAFLGTTDDLWSLTGVSRSRGSVMGDITTAAMVCAGSPTKDGYTEALDPLDGPKVVQYCNRAIEDRILAAIAALAARPSGVVVLGDEDRATLVAEISAMVGGQLRGVVRSEIRRVIGEVASAAVSSVEVQPL